MSIKKHKQMIIPTFILSSIPYSVSQKFENLQKRNCHIKILSTGSLTWMMFHTDEPQVLGVSVQNKSVRDLYNHVVLFYLEWFSKRTAIIPTQITN